MENWWFLLFLAAIFNQPTHCEIRNAVDDDSALVVPLPRKLPSGELLGRRNIIMQTPASTTAEMLSVSNISNVSSEKNDVEHVNVASLYEYLAGDKSRRPQTWANLKNLWKADQQALFELAEEGQKLKERSIQDLSKQKSIDIIFMGANLDSDIRMRNQHVGIAKIQVNLFLVWFLLLPLRQWADGPTVNLDVCDLQSEPFTSSGVGAWIQFTSTAMLGSFQRARRNRTCWAMVYRHLRSVTNVVVPIALEQNGRRTHMLLLVISRMIAVAVRGYQGWVISDEQATMLKVDFTTAHKATQDLKEIENEKEFERTPPATSSHTPADPMAVKFNRELRVAGFINESFYVRLVGIAGGALWLCVNAASIFRLGKRNFSDMYVSEASFALGTSRFAAYIDMVAACLVFASLFQTWKPALLAILVARAQKNKAMYFTDNAPMLAIYGFPGKAAGETPEEGLARWIRARRNLTVTIRERINAVIPPVDLFSTAYLSLMFCSLIASFNTDVLVSNAFGCLYVFFGVFSGLLIVWVVYELSRINEVLEGEQQTIIWDASCGHRQQMTERHFINRPLPKHVYAMFLGLPVRRWSAVALTVALLWMWLVIICNSVLLRRSKLQIPK